MAAAPHPDRPGGIPGSALAGPFPVGAYAAKLRDELRKRARLQLFGEVWNLSRSRARVYFELRDADGALPCAMWCDDFDALGLRAGGDGVIGDGAQVVVAGGPDYYPGSRTSSPAFSFHVTDLRPAGEGDLLAQLELLRRRLAAEGLFAPQKALPRPRLPRTIGVVTGEGGKARDDVLAGLRRRGWGGRVVWAFAPVQDRHAAPRIGRALQELAAVEAVEVVIVARGGGSLADLFCFCDETLCRTVALLRVPVIASVGHHTDRTLLDDVAAVSCSTPTHAAEEAVPVDCRRRARPWLATRDGSPATGAAPSSRARGCWRGSRARRPSTSPAIAGPCTSTCASCAPARPGARRPSARARSAVRSSCRGRPAPGPARARAARRTGAGLARARRSPPTTPRASSSAATPSWRTAPAAS